MSNITKTPFHRRNDSGELDVFEASNYFSGYNNHDQEVEFHNHHKLMRRTSLDSPIIRNTTTTLHDQDKKQTKKPNSPGARLATFFNSIFNQNKSKTKSMTKMQSFQEEGCAFRSHGGERKKRRSSMSYLPSFSSSTTTTTTTTTTDDSSLSSGFMTPPCSYAVYTPTKSVPNHKHVVSVVFQDVGPIKQKSLYLLDEELKLHDGKIKLNRNNWVDHHPRAATNDGDGDDDGTESDSDLFELKNCDLGIYSSPAVYL